MLYAPREGSTKPQQTSRGRAVKISLTCFRSLVCKSARHPSARTKPAMPKPTPITDVRLKPATILTSRTAAGEDDSENALLTRLEALVTLDTSLPYVEISRQLRPLVQSVPLVYYHRAAISRIIADGFATSAVATVATCVEKSDRARLTSADCSCR